MRIGLIFYILFIIICLICSVISLIFNSNRKISEPRKYSKFQNDVIVNSVNIPFNVRVVGISGKKVGNTNYIWHENPDGGAVFIENSTGNYVYVSNSETGRNKGGVSSIKFDNKGNIIDAYSIISGTNKNCAGGKTPWNTWLTCEEVDNGYVYECDPFKKFKKSELESMKRPSLGRYSHEAAAFINNKDIYLTEDAGRKNGRLFKFVSEGNVKEFKGNLYCSEKVKGNDGKTYLSWSLVKDPENPTSSTCKNNTFNGPEGIITYKNDVFFATKGDNIIWRYNTKSNLLDKIYELSTSENGILKGVDNLCIDKFGNIFVAEDGGNMEIVVLLAKQNYRPKLLLTVENQPNSEIAGPAFHYVDETTQKLFFSSQRGVDGKSKGITYEVTGNFNKLIENFEN